MLCKDIIDIIEQTYPKNYALDFDNVGLQAGRRDKNVQKIYLAVDATDEVLEQAISVGADMLITHHPLIFSPLKHVTDEDFISRRIMKMIQKDISYYAMHTNYDVLKMADLSAEILGIQDGRVLDETTADGQYGIGKIGVYEKEMTLSACAEDVKRRLQLEHVKVFGNPKQMISRVATSPGSGKSVVDIALSKGAQLLITGDIDHHAGIDAAAQGLAIIDAGHYGTEYIFMDDMERFFLERLESVEIVKAEKQIPFVVL